MFSINNNPSIDNSFTLKLKELGFQFDPFEHLEASADPNLGSYLVTYPNADVIWDTKPALIFAPAGGGKTALRIATTSSVWTSYGTEHTFPVPYLLSTQTLPDEHRLRIGAAAAKALLIALITQPELLQRLNQNEEAEFSVVRFLSAGLPRPVSSYARMLQRGAAPTFVTRLLNRSYLLPPRTIVPDLGRLCDTLIRLDRPLVSTADLFTLMDHAILDVLGFTSITLHIDNVDADGATITNADAMAKLIHWPLSQIDRWKERRIILKVFLPSELAPLLHDYSTRRLHITWKPELLAEVLRKRIYSATQGIFNSLDAFSSRNLQDIEMQLANAVIPLPREVIWLTRLLMHEYYQRTSKRSGQRLVADDVQRALSVYRKRAVFPGPLLSPHCNP